MLFSILNNDTNDLYLMDLGQPKHVYLSGEPKACEEKTYGWNKEILQSSIVHKVGAEGQG